jgi:uncharacterized membrane protein
MKDGDSDSMNTVIARVLRYGVLLSSAVIVLGTLGLAAGQGASDASAFFEYPGSVPSNVPASVSAFLTGLTTFSPFSWIELGVILLMATPVSRVAISVYLFGSRRDRLYALITSVVLALLLFSMLVTPFISIFHG